MKDLTDRDTFNAATSQEVFDFVAHHLLTQNEKSIRGNLCSYKAQKNLKCAAGCLISEDNYDTGFEGLGWNEVSNKLGMLNHCSLVADLQGLHDHTIVRKWKNELINFANFRGLSTDVLEQFN